MKMIKKLLTLFCTVASVIAIGCSDVDEDATVSEGATRSVPKDYSVSFLAADGTAMTFDQVGVTTTSSSRTITPASLSTSGLKWYIWGKDLISSSTVNPQEVTFTPDASDNTKGTVTLDFSASNYKFVLAAVETASVPATITDTALKSAAVLIGYANADLRNNDSIKFYMSADGLTGTGAVNLTLMYDSTDTSWGDPATSGDLANTISSTATWSINVGIYNKTTDAVVSSASQSAFPKTGFFSTTGSAFSKNNIAAGTYNFVVEFANSSTGKKYNWNDTINILPNQTTTKTISIPNVIETEPKAPTDFYVSYIEPASKDTDRYTVMLSWNGTSITNEQYFQVSTLEVTDAIETSIKAAGALANVDDTVWSSISTSSSPTVYGKEFYGNSDENWVAGSLQKNNDHIMFSLPLGKRYAMKLEAVNDAGISKAVYVKFADGTNGSLSWSDTDPNHTGSYTTIAFTTNEIDATYSLDGDSCIVEETLKATPPVKVPLSINLFRLTYHLNGGTYASSSSTSDTTTKDIVEYHSYGAIKIQNPINDPNFTGHAYPTLVQTSSSKRWTSWRIDNIEGDTYGDIDTSSPTKSPTLKVEAKTKASNESGGSAIPYCYAPYYQGYENLSLYANYSVTDASIWIYDDNAYDFQAAEFTLSGTGVSHVTDTKYNITEGAAITCSYTRNSTYGGTGVNRPTFEYSSMTAEITKTSSSNSSIWNITISPSSNTSFSIAPTSILSNGTYNLTITGVYKGKPYTNIITLEVKDS